MAVSLNRAQRSGARRRSTGQAFSDINVTPFVDVMLVLLVIFMVTTPMLTVGVPVDLPKTKAARMNDQAEPLVVSVDANGKSYLQEAELEGDALVERLIAISGNNPDAKIYVRGDQKINYGRVMEIMGVIAAAGFNKVSLIAEMPSGADKGKKLTVRKASSKGAASVPSPTGQLMTQGVLPQAPPHGAFPQAIPQFASPPQAPAARAVNPVAHPANSARAIRGQ